MINSHVRERERERVGGRENKSRDLDQALQNGAEMIEVYAPLHITFCTLQPKKKMGCKIYIKKFISLAACHNSISNSSSSNRVALIK